MSNFKAGDKVYSPTKSGKILTVLVTDDESYPVEVGGVTYTLDGRVIDYYLTPQVFHATPENHALLSQLYPNVEFEKPKAVGSDLTRQMLADGAKEVLCWVSDESDDDAITEKCVAAVVAVHDTHQTFVTGISCHWLYAIPVPRNFYAMDDE